MKLVVLFAILALLFFVLGARRSRPREPEQRAPAPPAGPQAMVRCAECGLHLPASDALPGKGGVFCSAAHRAVFEARSQA